MSAADKTVSIDAPLVIFPSTRRRRMIQRAAALAASSKNPEKTILATINRARTSHLRKNIAAEAIQHDVRELEIALRVQVSLLLFRSGIAR